MKVLLPTATKCRKVLAAQGFFLVADPYAIDSIHAYLMEPDYKLEEDGYFIEKDATFSISDFMRDLERFYQAMRLHFAFEQMCLGNDEPALTLYEDGKHFAGLPFLSNTAQTRMIFRMSTILLPVVIC